MSAEPTLSKLKNESCNENHQCQEVASSLAKVIFGPPEEENIDSWLSVSSDDDRQVWRSARVLRFEDVYSGSTLALTDADFNHVAKEMVDRAVAFIEEDIKGMKDVVPIDTRFIANIPRRWSTGQAVKIGNIYFYDVRVANVIRQLDINGYDRIIPASADEIERIIKEYGSPPDEPKAEKAATDWWEEEQNGCEGGYIEYGEIYYSYDTKLYTKRAPSRYPRVGFEFPEHKVDAARAEYARSRDNVSPMELRLVCPGKEFPSVEFAYCAPKEGTRPCHLSGSIREDFMKGAKLTSGEVRYGAMDDVFNEYHIFDTTGDVYPYTAYDKNKKKVDAVCQRYPVIRTYITSSSKNGVTMSFLNFTILFGSPLDAFEAITMKRFADTRAGTLSIKYTVANNDREYTEDDIIPHHFARKVHTSTGKGRGSNRDKRPHTGGDYQSASKYNARGRGGDRSDSKSSKGDPSRGNSSHKQCKTAKSKKKTVAPSNPYSVLNGGES